MTTPIEETYAELARLLNDIDEALPSVKHRDEFLDRLSGIPASDGLSQKYFGAVLTMAWQAKDAPVLAGRVYEIGAKIFEKTT